MVKSPKVDWGQLNSMLYSITFLRQQQGDSASCKKCLGSDHFTDLCALADQGSSRSKSYDRRDRYQTMQSTNDSPYKMSSSRVETIVSSMRRGSQNDSLLGCGTASVKLK